MKKPIAVLLAAALFPAAALSADWQTQCVAPKAVAKGDRLVVTGTRIFAKPVAGTPITVIRTNIALRAVARQGHWLRLAGGADSPPYKDGAAIGWVLESEVDYQDLRNCN